MLSPFESLADIKGDLSDSTYRPYIDMAVRDSWNDTAIGVTNEFSNCADDGDDDFSYYDAVVHGYGESLETDDRDSTASSSDDSSYNDENLPNLLAEWAVMQKIPLSALGTLLHVLSPFHPTLPLDPRTLLHTPKDVAVRELSGGGSYAHVGILHNIEKLHDAKQLDKCLEENIVSVQINIDGLPIYKSSGYQLWPILGLVKGSVDEKPFTIGIYGGTKKPESLSRVLRGVCL